MKKLISVMLVAVMVLSLSVVAFAEGGSVAKKPDVSVDGGTGKTASGETVELVVETPKNAPTQAQLDQAKADAVAKAGAGATVGDPFEIHVEKNGAEDKNAKGVTATIVYDGEGEVAGVLYQNEDGSWSYATATNKGNGKYEVTFEHFCTAMLVFKAPEKAPDTSKDTGKTSSSTGVTSPKTGWD